MTRQEVYEHVRAHLIAQGERCVEAKMRIAQGAVDLVCVFRNRKGMKCAIGSLIPDVMYTHMLEGVGISDLMTRDGRWAPSGSAMKNYHEHDYPRCVKMCEVLNTVGVPADEPCQQMLQDLMKFHDGLMQEYTREQIGPMLDGYKELHGSRWGIV